MPRRNRSTRTDRYAPLSLARGAYPLAELTDDFGVLVYVKDHMAAQRACMRSVHGR